MNRFFENLAGRVFRPFFQLLSELALKPLNQPAELAWRLWNDPVPLERSLTPCRADPQKSTNTIAIARVPIEAKKQWNREAKNAAKGLQRATIIIKMICTSD